MMMLIKRNFLLYFRNRSGVVLSLLGAMISFILYLVFLKDNIKADWAQVPDTNQLLDMWLISGTLAITGLTTTLSSFSQLAKDRESQVTQDLLITDLGHWGLQCSYLVSSALIGLFMQLIMFGLMLTYFIFADKISFDWTLTPQLLLVMVLNSLLATLFNALLVHYFKSVDSLGRMATVIGAVSGFLVGTYVPIGSLPNVAQTLMKFTPFTYIASLFRQVLMGQNMTVDFAGNTQALNYFEKIMGIRLDWNPLLTMNETYYIVVVVLLAFFVLWLVQNLAAGRRASTV